jgi:hypothetical protein
VLRRARRRSRTELSKWRPPPRDGVKVVPDRCPVDRAVDPGWPLGPASLHSEVVLEVGDPRLAARSPRSRAPECAVALMGTSNGASALPGTSPTSVTIPCSASCTLTSNPNSVGWCGFPRRRICAYGAPLRGPEDRFPKTLINFSAELVTPRRMRARVCERPAVPARSSS